eukprot:comp13408_c1_seq1/m.8911 comp13408_c1_seq1/g.8911  ORF comp13408_c1_seq1/g.8911 comp13408_c1_seq1/m.8911 type:complete len:323 (-) comp13408_c1_seq1:580-1548(-)
MHVHYHNDLQLRRQYGHYLAERGCRSEADWKKVLEGLQEERKRRANENSSFVERKKTIAERYTPLSPDVYIFQQHTHLHPHMQSLIHCLKSEPDSTLRRQIALNGVQMFGDQIYSVQFLHPDYCKELLNEVKHFLRAGMPRAPANTMNRQSVLLDELGHQSSLATPIASLFQVLAEALFDPDDGAGSLDSHRTFFIAYEVGAQGGDTDLGLHYDNAELTLNICLGEEGYEGGELFFSGTKHDTDQTAFCPVDLYNHQVGRALMHRGSHTHGALPVTKGTRINLIMWGRSSKCRDKKCGRCGEAPRLVEMEGFGDGFSNFPGH